MTTLQDRQIRYRSNPTNQEKMRSRESERRERLKASGICLLCKIEPSLPDRQHCFGCKAKQAEYHRTRDAKAVEQGICVSCHKDASLTSIQVCETCFFKKVSRNHFGVNSHWRFLQSLLVKQASKCPYTGVSLVIGVNASLDHIKPVRHFPELKTSLSNLEWVDKSINEMKRDRTPEQFLDLLQLILNYRKI